MLTIKSCQVNMELGIIAALLPFANTTFAKVDVVGLHYSIIVYITVQVHVHV